MPRRKRGVGRTIWLSRKRGRRKGAVASRKVSREGAAGNSDSTPSFFALAEWAKPMIRLILGARRAHGGDQPGQDVCGVGYFSR